MPARRKYAVPRGLQPVRRRLATGEVRLYWYHRETGERLQADPTTAEGFLEVTGLDARAKAVEALSGAPEGSLAALWTAYTASPEWRGLKPRTRSDYQAVRDGYISITPLQPDMTAHDALGYVDDLALVGESEIR